MGNVIRFHRIGAELSMSNGLTAVLVDTLAIAASRLAVEPWQEELAVWIAGRDQGVFGPGMVGFDVAELGFSRERLAEEKRFWSEVIAAARGGLGWELLDYPPRRETLLEALDRFAAMIGAVDELDVAPRNHPWGEPPRPARRCERHLVLEHVAGCVICNGI